MKKIEASESKKVKRIKLPTLSFFFIYMKTCSKCKIQTNNFGPDKTKKTGLSSQCRECSNKRIKLYNKTKEGLITKIFRDQRKSSKKRGHRMPCYTIKELKKWVFSQEKFHILYEKWVKSGYKKNKIPSLDRKNNLIGYSFDNIQIVTWEYNHIKQVKSVEILTNRITILEEFIILLLNNK